MSKLVEPHGGGPLKPLLAPEAELEGVLPEVVVKEALKSVPYQQRR